MNECAGCGAIDRRLWNVEDDLLENWLLCGECISFTGLWDNVVEEEDTDGNEL
jgi:hypothetical protein